MIAIYLYIYTGDNRVINKDLTLLKSADCTVYNDCSLQNPTMLLNVGSIDLNANYAYIPDWGRYYYISDISLQPGNKAVVSMHIDVLKTYAAYILASPALCVRNENIGINDVPDQQLPLNDEKSIKVATLGSALNKNGSYPYVLNVAGGGGE